MSSSILNKSLLTLITVFTLVLAGSTTYQYWQQRDLIHSILSEQLHDKASNYFDSLNMMMLTATMAQKETLHIQQAKHVKSVSILHTYRNN